MANRTLADQYKDFERDPDREQRVADGYRRDPGHESPDSGEEGQEDSLLEGKAIFPEDVVEIIAPLLKEKPQPLVSFEDTCIPEFVKHVVRGMGFTEPTVIQKYCRQQFIQQSPSLSWDVT